MLASCKKEKEELPEQTYKTDVKSGEYTLSKATHKGEDWIYFSFITQSEVSGIDHSNYKDLDTWDIAFNRFNVRTNSGISTNNIGQGGAYDTQSTDWASVMEAPGNNYIVDDTIQILESDTTYEYMNSTGSVELNKWLEFSGPPPVYTMSDHIYIVKTAKSKYAKIWLKSYHSDADESGHITFKYAYQNGDGRKFE